MPDPYLSEIKYRGGASLDFIEVAVDAGADISNIVLTIYQEDGTIRTTNLLETFATTIAGRDIYVISTTQSTTFNGVSVRNAISLSEGATVFQFVSFTNVGPITAVEGPAAGLTSTQIGRAEFGESLETTDRGGSYALQTSPNSGTIPCFVRGTKIATLRGAVAVETLKAGDVVLDGYGGTRTVLANLMRQVALTEEEPGARAIVIAPGALGPNMPERPLAVSRQHRFVIQSRIVERMFGVPSVLVPAAKLLELDGVSVGSGEGAVTYHHLLLDQHGVVIAEGAYAESYLTTSRSLATLVALQRRLVMSLVGTQTAPCMPLVDGSKAKALIKRHMKNGQPLVAGPLIEAGALAA